MIEPMDRSAGKILGYVVSGDVTKGDYQTLVPAVEAAVEEHATVSLLFDLTGFRWEKVSAWGADLGFGEKFHDSIGKMAIVGDKKWERHLAQPYYAKESRFFETTADAWTWLES